MRKILVMVRFFNDCEAWVNLWKDGDELERLAYYDKGSEGFEALREMFGRGETVAELDDLPECVRVEALEFLKSYEVRAFISVYDYIYRDGNEVKFSDLTADEMEEAEEAFKATGYTETTTASGLRVNFYAEASVADGMELEGGEYLEGFNDWDTLKGTRLESEAFEWLENTETDPRYPVFCEFWCSVEDLPDEMREAWLDYYATEV